MLKENKYIFVVIIIVIIFIGIVYLNKYNNHSPSSTVSYPYINVTHISKQEYGDELYNYSLNPIMNGKEKIITLPNSDLVSYYKVIIKDEGYNDKLPIDIKVFFAVDENNNPMDSSYFIITELKAPLSKELNFPNRK